jgi:putative transposase
MPSRKCNFKLYPNATERAGLERSLAAHCKVYNTLLETSKLRHKAGLPGFNRTSVNQATKAIRNAHGWIKDASLAQSLQVTGERLVKAFEAFFRRVEAGATPGYPRFKSVKRYPGFGFKAEGQGYRLHRKADPRRGTKGGLRYGSVTLSGIGNIAMKGRARFVGRPTSAEIIRKGDDWYLSVTFDVEEAMLARQCAGQGPFAFDVGISDLLTTLKYHDGAAVYDKVANPRWLKRKLSDIVELQREVSQLEQRAIARSGKTKGFPVDRQLRAAYARLRSVHKKVRNQRGDFYHKLSAWLVSRFGHIITEELSVASMQADEGKSSGLKRGVADAGWSGFLQMLRSKAEEASAKYEEVPTRIIKPTRRCSNCGGIKRREDMPLHQRMYMCAACGFTLERDRSACRNMMRWSLEGRWWAVDIEIGPGTGPETASEKALAPAQGQ